MARTSATPTATTRATTRATAPTKAPTSTCCSPLSDQALTTPQAESLAHAFAALADPVRLRLLSLIATCDAGEVCACDVVAPLGKSQPTVSHHLKVLREAGLVRADKRGIWMWYRAVPERLAEVRAALA